MKVENPPSPRRLLPGLVKSLGVLRQKRGFDAAKCVQAKSFLLNDYIQQNALCACVVGISGGIDSAVVLALASHAARQQGSPIRKIVPVLAPIHSSGATGQDGGIERGMELISSLGLAACPIDLTAAHHSLKSAADASSGIDGKAWADGQLVSYLRTPAFYYLTSLLHQEGLPAVVLGTTNRDEGGYLGYFGKASDGMVDIQLISDLHKSEIFQMAHILGVPPSILAATPSGDMFDGRSDEDVFGAPYDFVELFTHLQNPDLRRLAGMDAWNVEEIRQYEELSTRLEKLHKYNVHKYKVGSPAVHLDIYESSVPDGWHHGIRWPVWPENPDTRNFVAPFGLSTKDLSSFHHYCQQPQVISDPFESMGIRYFQGLLTHHESHHLVKISLAQNWLPVGLDGKRKNFVQGQDKIGSTRASTYSIELANTLWSRISGQVPMILLSSQDNNPGARDAAVWRAVGINPLFRFIRYENDGSLVAHYDAPYDNGRDLRTLKTLLIYLTTANPEEGGATRFVRDLSWPFRLEHDFADWTRGAYSHEVELAVQPVAGDALVYDHRKLHDCEKVRLQPQSPARIVLRTDIVYQKIRYS